MRKKAHPAVLEIGAQVKVTALDKGGKVISKRRERGGPWLVYVEYPPSLLSQLFQSKMRTGSWFEARELEPA
ncbi:MAG: hypothetical protein GTO63_07970 [Anaerolineae bacterium]|nr:hypothetical protein [Anaerolineae bacterium]NIN94866.1 hypothetical protein [Anaerolineae bacterium]NIQ77917.1 hypothetical protein [Anaerolineae bacterium]